MFGGLFRFMYFKWLSFVFFADTLIGFVLRALLHGNCEPLSVVECYDYFVPIHAERPYVILFQQEQ